MKARGTIPEVSRNESVSHPMNLRNFPSAWTSNGRWRCRVKAERRENRRRMSPMVPTSTPFEASSTWKVDRSGRESEFGSLDTICTDHSRSTQCAGARALSTAARARISMNIGAPDLQMRGWRRASSPAFACGAPGRSRRSKIAPRDVHVPTGLATSVASEHISS